MRALIRAGLRDLTRRPLQSALVVLSLALGVAVVIAIDLANASAQHGFELSAQTVAGAATHRLVGGPAGVPEQLYPELRVGLGLRGVAPIVEGIAALPAFNQRPVRILGVDLFAEGPFRTDFERLSALEPGFAPFFTESGTVVITEQFAEAHGLQPGDRLEVQTGDRLATVTVLGVLTGETALGSTDLLLMDIAGAQELLGMIGKLSRIDLILDAASAAELASGLPPGVRLESAGDQVEAANQLTAAFRTNLTALSLLALVVGSFLIYNTITFSVLRRRPVLGTLRAIGCTGDQILRMVLIEAGIIALLGSAIGIGLGLLMARGAVNLVSQTISDFYFLARVQRVALTPALAAKGAGLGLGAGLLAALAPAIEASRVRPVEVLRRSVTEGRSASRLLLLTAGGVGLATIGAIGFRLSGASLTWSFVAMLAILVGIALLAPLATQVLVFFSRVARSGLIVRMAVGSLPRHISRTGPALAALTVALAVAVGVTLMITSFRSTVENWLSLTLRSDLYVGSPATSGTRPMASLSPDLESRLEAIPGVEQAEALRAVLVESEFGEVHLSAVDPGRVRDAGLYRLAQASAADVWEQVRTGAVLISESLAGRNSVSSSIRLTTDHGAKSFPVAGVFYDYSTDRGTVLMSRAIYLANWDDPAISSLGLTAAHGVDPVELAERVRAALEGTGLEVQVNGQVRQQALAIFDRSFAITAALRLLAVVVAFFGVLGALLALLLERSREFATLSALGLTPGGLGRLMFIESGLMGLTASLLAMPTGLLLAVLLIEVIDARSFGWTIRLEWQWLPFVQAVVVGVGASVAAALYPIARLRRLQLAQALTQE